MDNVLRESYAELLDGAYECVDRLVLNAYFKLAQSPGGFRHWWRQLQGSDADLDNTHLMRFAGRFARRVRAYAHKHSIPVVDCGRGERQHLVAAQYLPEDSTFTGVFAILVKRAPAPVWDVQTTKDGRIRNLRKKYPYVKQYAFHILDPDWGHLIIKLCPHPPFGAQIILNGHEYVARQAHRAQLTFTQEGNCFTQVSDPTHLAQLADTLRSPDAVGPLRQVCERWIYTTCLNFALPLEAQARTRFKYQYSVYQLELSYNLLFQRGQQMEQVAQGLIDRVRTTVDIPTLKTIFGKKRRPTHRARRRSPRLERVIEKPVYDLTVFKLHFDKLTLKLYTKGAHVLRLEVITHNARTLPGGSTLVNLPAMLTHLHAILRRFSAVLHCLDTAFVSSDLLEPLPEATQVGRTRVGGIDLNQPRIRAVMQALLNLAAQPGGFRVTELAAHVRAKLNLPATAYTSRHAAYDLKKLRGKHWVHKRGRSRRYEIPPEGLRIMTALLVLREQVIKPVLAGVLKPKRGPKPAQQTQRDALYQAIQLAMFNLFQALGIAV
jgi:hypothetical protein